MKKYNLSTIMRRAWELVKKVGMTLSCGLKKAWKEAKEMSEKISFNKTAKIAAVHNGYTNQYIGTEFDSESNYFTFSLWEKNGKKRIYANDYKGRSIGYIDCVDNNSINTEYSERSEAHETMQWFINNYAF